VVYEVGSGGGSIGVAALVWGVLESSIGLGTVGS